MMQVTKQHACLGPGNQSHPLKSTRVSLPSHLQPRVELDAGPAYPSGVEALWEPDTDKQDAEVYAILQRGS